ncbi:periplasmic nitrate reductase, NapE protein [Halomonas salifodinae]|uniref:periplasmic nitrate reductase, NapE protein n=1 Tax=Halomonas salifodinae TaxID=438745 RepID=UPI0033B9DF51
MAERGGMEKEAASRKRQEIKLFLFLTVLLFPLLAVAVVGGYGFAVWIFQMFVGPPGPPA